MYCPEFNKVDSCLKDKEIEILKIKYNTKQIELMEYLLALSEYVQDWYSKVF